MASLFELFAASLRRSPLHPALVLDGQSWTYQELADEAALVAGAIMEYAPSKNPLIGIFADRGPIAYSGVLGILGAGRGFVPLHHEYPQARLLEIIERAELDLIICDTQAVEPLLSALSTLSRPITLIAPELNESALAAHAPNRHKLITGTELPSAPQARFFTKASPKDLAYLLFTSGSTGKPKGVAVRHKSASIYLQHMVRSLELNAQDRISQTFKLAFDLAIHDLFTTWAAGATLYPLSRSARMAPGRFIRQNELTVWFSVPTTALTMERFRQVAPGAFPSLRLSLFCGEHLPASLVERWQEAAPNSQIHNIYGPTEATIAVTSYRWQGRAAAGAMRNDIVPLGEPFPGTKLLIVDENDRPVPPQTPGELLLSGVQITDGYWQDPARTKESYITLPGDDDALWYRTGDLVVRDEQGNLHILGRKDHQIQLAGHRVELSEIDHALRQACGHGLVASIPWPIRSGTVGGIVSFIVTDKPLDQTALLTKCRQSLPPYMLPSKIIGLDALPRNTSGKIDRNALRQMLDSGEVS